MLALLLVAAASAAPTALVEESVESDVAPLRIDGLVAAVFTPFDEESKMNLTVVPAQSAYLTTTGVEWAFVGGTTGESLSLTVEERKTLVGAWMKTGHRENVIVHVGAESINDAMELAEHAATSGAKAVASMPPVFFSPANAHAVALWLQAICARAPGIPCYYYHIPSMTHFNGVMMDLVEAIEDVGVPTFAGIKYTGLYTYPGYMDAETVLMYRGGKYEVLSGREDMMLEGLSIGIKGHVGSQFNFAGDCYNAIREDFAKNGLTPASSTRIRSEQMRAVNMIHAWSKASPAGVNGAKYFMNLAGVPVGDARLPAIPIDSDGEAALSKAFTEVCAKPLGGASPLHMCPAR